MNPNHQDTIMSSKYGEESWDTNAPVNNWLDDLATGTEIIIKIRWLSHALYYSLDSRLCCSFSFTHQTDPIPNLSLDMATLSLRLWPNIKPKKLVIHLSGDYTLLCSDSQLNFQRQAYFLFVRKLLPVISILDQALSISMMYITSRYLWQSTMI